MLQVNVVTLSVSDGFYASCCSHRLSNREQGMKKKSYTYSYSYTVLFYDLDHNRTE